LSLWRNQKSQPFDALKSDPGYSSLANFFAVTRIHNEDTLTFLERFSLNFNISFCSMIGYFDTYFRLPAGTAIVFFSQLVTATQMAPFVFDSLDPGFLVERNFLNLVANLCSEIYDITVAGSPVPFFLSNHISNYSV